MFVMVPAKFLVPGVLVWELLAMECLCQLVCHVAEMVVINVELAKEPVKENEI